MNQLLLTPGVASLIRDKLLSSDRETAGILYAHCVRTTLGFRLLYRDFWLPPEEAYLQRTNDSIRLSPDFLAPALKKARVNHWSVLLTHTHPWPGLVSASAVDLQGESVLMPTVFNRIPNLPHGRLILGHHDYEAALLTEESGAESRLKVVELGPYLRELPDLKTERLNTVLDEQFDRQVKMFGKPGQVLLGQVSVGIVGLGGTGSIVCEQLAHLGIRDFVLIDPDTLEKTNLNRVVGTAPEDVGRAKVDIAAQNIRRINPDAQATTIVGSALLNATAKQLLDCDFFFICTDSHGSRAVLNQLSYQYYLPAIDIGVRIDADKDSLSKVVGRVQMIGPGLSCLVCGNLLSAEAVRRDLMTDFERQTDPYVVGSPEPQPSVISINSTVSSLGVSMFLSALTGVPLKSRFSIYQGEAGTVRSVGNEPLPNCVVCSNEGAAGKGDEWELPGRNK